MTEDENAGRLRTFVLGGVVGASAAVAAAARRRRRPGSGGKQPEHEAGLEAFEAAPCYRELVESERGSAR